nr:hypothetical protein Iba_chr14dCG4680 [Ipomoea batatas]GMD93583.1 hypothetical protein Iba_chr14fCG8840 [Ipomoea batatas]
MSILIIIRIRNSPRRKIVPELPEFWLRVISQFHHPPGWWKTMLSPLMKLLVGYNDVGMKSLACCGELNS